MMKVRWHRWAPVCAMVALVLPREGHTSQVHFREVPLARVAERAAFVVEATYRKTSDEETLGLRFDVVGALTPDSQRVVGTIRVHQASRGFALMMQSAEATQPMPSVSVEQLERAARAKLLDQRSFIVFLVSGASSQVYTLAAEDAVADVKQLDALRTASPRFVWAGRALNSKASAVLERSGQIIQIEGLPSWPEAMTGKNVEVSGRLVRKKSIPEPVVADGGAIAQGASGESWVLQNPKWSTPASKP